MKKLIFLVASICFAGIPGNFITLTNNTGSTVNQPYTISRWFAQGEILNFPAPSGITQYQADVKTRWPDGSVQHALVSFWRSTANTVADQITFINTANPCYLGDQATCTAAGLGAAGMAAFNGGSWGAAIQATQNGTTVTTDAKTLIAGGYFKYWIRGPIATVVVVEDRTTARSYDFGWNCAQTYQFKVNTSTNTLTSYDYATGTTITPHGFTEGESISIGTTTTPGPAPLTGASSPNRYARNITSTTFQTSGTPTGALDTFTTIGAGANYATTCGAFSADYSTATWTNDSTYRSLHPQFILTFFPGWSGVYDEFVMQNGWTTALEDERYALTLLNGASNANTVVTKTFTHYARTEWIYRAWDGTGTVMEFPTTAQIFVNPPTPPNFVIDLNKQYMIYSKFLPQLDPSLVTDPTAGYHNVVTEYVLTGTEPFGCNPTGTYCGNWLEYFASTGGRGDIGWMPAWYAKWIFSGFDPKYTWVVRGDADLAGTAPYHTWEGATGKWFDSAHTIDAYGFPISVNARPTVREEYGPTGWDQAGSSGDKLTFVQALPTGLNTGFMLSQNWGWGLEYGQSDPQHQPAWHYVPYLTTGDYFYLEDGLSFISQYLARGGWTGRHNDWAMTITSTRGNAWSLRSVYQMAVMAPDSSLPSSSNLTFPEKAYFKEKGDNNAVYLEALAGVTDGHFSAPLDPSTFVASTETDKYKWAAMANIGVNKQFNPWGTTMNRVNPSVGAALVPPASANDAMYMGSFLNLTVGWAAEMGMPTDKVSRNTTKIWIECLYGSNPRDVGQYSVPTAMGLPVATLATSLTSTSTSIVLTAPVPWIGLVDPPYVIGIQNSSITATPNEWVYICSQSGSTLTVCPNGRGAINPLSSLGASAHTAPAYVQFLNYSPYLHDIPDFHAGMRTGYGNLQLPFGFGGAYEGYDDLSIATMSYAENSYSSGHGGYQAFADMLGYKTNGATCCPTPQTYTGLFAGSGYNPQLYYLMRRNPPSKISITPGDTFALIAYYAPSAGVGDSACTVDGTDDGQSTSRWRTYVKTGLTAGTPYTSTIHCTGDYYDSGSGAGNTAVSYTTTAALTGTKSFSITSGGGASTVYLDYGATSSLGSTVSASCSSGCTLAATVSKGLLYYRLRNASATGSTSSTIVR